MIAVSVKSKSDIAAIEEIMEKTWDYVDGKTEVFTDTPLHLKGKLQKMSLEMKNYYQKSLDYFGITSADRDIHYYVVDCTDSQLLAILVTAFFFVVAIPMLVAFISGKAKARRAALEAEVEADMGYAYQPYPAEYKAYDSTEEAPAVDVPVEEASQDLEAPAE